MRYALLCLSLWLFASPLAAQDVLGLAAPKAVVQSGLLKHILPRFSLKTGIRVKADDAGAMVLTAEGPGTQVFQGAGVVYRLRIGNDKAHKRFRDWLVSDIGKRTVDSFQPDGVQLFSSAFEVVQEVEEAIFDGNAARGGKLALTHCGRCHVIGPENRMSGLGSSPSFPVLRALSDWDIRFQTFYVLAPHGAFTQITDLTEPFPIDLPSPIVPIEFDQDAFEAILAFVNGIEAADLGAPLQTQ